MQTSLTIDVGQRVLPSEARGYDTALKIHAGILKRIKMGHSGYEDAHTDVRLESFFGLNGGPFISALFEKMRTATRITFHIERRSSIYCLRINVKRGRVAEIGAELNISASSGKIFALSQLIPRP